VEEGWGAMAELVKAGKVRWLGASNFSVAQLKRVQPIHPVASLQPPYSMLRRDIEAEILPYCEKENIGILCYSPMQTGLLTGTFSHERMKALPANDWRRNSPRFQEPQLSQSLARVDELKKIAARLSISMAQLAIAWVLRKQIVTSAIVGARSPRQIEETAPGGDVVLSHAVLDEIERILA
jgi:aryl-alcohol dehydrogenase-like predicted oxidoreductase